MKITAEHTNISVQRLDWIDSLKGMAILSIIMVHCGTGAIQNQRVHSIILNGARGCQMFFIISGFMAYLSYNKRNVNFDKLRGSLKWIIHKIYNLVPLYYISLLCSLCYFGRENSYWAGPAGFVSNYNILAHLFMLHGFNPYYINSVIGVEWYIGTLVIFYFLMPVIYKWIRDLASALTVFFLSIIFSNVIGNFLLQYNPGIEQYILEPFIWVFSLIGEFPMILLGVVLYYIAKNYYGNLLKFGHRGGDMYVS